jgi:hypothetical protein
MIVTTATAPPPGGAPLPGKAPSPGLIRLRRASLAVLALIVVEFGLGVYVSLWARIPAADRGAGLGTAIASGPVGLTAHAALGLLLGVGALGCLAQAIALRRPAIIALAAAALFALAVATAAGASVTSAPDAAGSMAMSVTAGVALLCYAACLYLLPAPRRA